MIEYLNIASFVVAVIATGYLFLTASRCNKGLKTGFVLSGIGVAIGLGVHSLAEALEAFKVIDTNLLTTIMPALVFVGSILLIAGVYKLYTAIRSAGGG